MPGKQLKEELERHISPEKIAAFVNEAISAEEREPIIEHLSNCPRCRKLVSEVVRSQAAVKDPDL